jgi:hypothetical protein
MKFEIKNKEEKKGEKKVKLYLEADAGGVDIVAIGEKEEKWYLMRFANGQFHKYCNIPDNIGVKVDENGRITEK